MYPKRSSDGCSEDGAESLPSTSRSENGSRSEEEEEDEEEEEEEESESGESDNVEEEEGDSGSETDGTTSEDSETDEDDDVEDLPIAKKDRNTAVKIEEHDSDSSDGQSDKCPICLSRFGAQETGTPDSCDHAFCLDCILEWSKNMNTCPVDRRTFDSVAVRKTLKGKVLRMIQVKGKTEREDNGLDEEEPTYCEVCRLSDREDRLLLCDGCDMGFHLECLNPPLQTVPVEQWFCPQCAVENGQDLAEEVGIEEGEVMALLEDENVSLRNIGLRSRGGYRLLPRTRQSETVRLRIQRTRATQRHVLNGENDTTPTTSGIRSRHPPARRRRTVKRRRKTTRRRKKTTKSSSSDKKPTKRKTSGSKKSGTTKRRKKPKRRRRKTVKRRVFRKITPVSNSTPKSRLAEQLGLKLLPNRMLPVIDTPSSVKAAKATSGRRQNDVAASTLSLFGTRDDLIAFDDSYDDEGDVAVACPGPSAVSRRRHAKALSNSALLSHRPLSIGGMRSRQTVPSISLPPPQQQESFDLLGSILTSQSLLTMKGNNFTIQRDGSLLPRRTVGLPPRSADQCPADPVHGPRDNGSGGGGAAKDGSRDDNTSSHGPSTPSSSGRSEGWTHCSTTNQPSSDRSYNDLYRSNTGSTGEGSSHGGVDYNRRTHVSPQKKRTEKEQKKPADDDDIDIYSDIESGSFENEAEDVSMDRLSAVEDEESPDAEQSSFARMGNEDIDNDGEEAEVRDSDECSDDDLVIDESIKHEEEDLNSVANLRDDCGDGSQDVSDNEDLVIDDTEGGPSHQAGEESDVDCENTNRCSSDMSDMNRSNLDVDDASNDNLGENETAAEVAFSDEGAEEDDDEEEAGRGDVVEDSNNIEAFEHDKSNSNLQDSIESPFAEEQDGEAQGYSSEGESVDIGNEVEEEGGNEHCHEDQELVHSSEEVEDEEADEEVEGEVEHEEEEGGEELEESEPIEEGNEVEEGGNEAEGEYEEHGEDEAREEGNVGEAEVTERHEEDEEYERTSANEEEQMNYDGLKDEKDLEEHHNAEALEVAKAVNSGNEDVGTDEENAKTELCQETSFSSEIHETDAMKRTEERDESNEEAEIDVSKLAHRQKRRAMTSVRETSGPSRHGPSYRHKRRRDYEDGEILDAASQRKVKPSRKRRQSRTESPDEYDNYPRVNISELPRIPKIKRDRPCKDRAESNGPSGNPSSSSSASANSASESKRTGVMARLDKGGTAEISWKKLSHNNKTRNYRDGKPKSEQKHYRVKESKDNSSDKWTGVQATQLSSGAESKRRTSESDKDKRKDKDREGEYYEKTERHSETKDWQRTKEKEKAHRMAVKHEKDKYKEKHREKHYKSEKHRDSKEKHKHGKTKEVPVERSKEKTYEKVVVVSEKEDKREKKEQKREKIRHLERMHREEKHREHKQQKREKERAIAAAALSIRSREESPIESKEVYASGDSIIVNVNFSRPTGKENAPKDVKPTDEKLFKEKEMGEEASDVKRRVGDVDVRERLGEKRSSDDTASDSNKRMKHDDSKGMSQVDSPSDRWNPFDSDVEEPPIPIDSDLHSEGSLSPLRSPLDNGPGNDTDSDSDVVEIIQPSNLVSIDPVIKDKRDDPTQSPDTISDEFEDFTNCDSNLGDTIPRSPPSPADDNSVYDPFDPTKSLSPSPCSSPEPESLSGSKVMTENPEPPPLPELPPLPPEPEPEEPLPPRPNSPLSSSPSSPTVSNSPFTSSAPTTSLASSVQTITAPATSVHSHPCVPIPPNVPVSVAGSSVGSAPQPPPPPLMAHTLPPPFSLANIHVPPPNYIPRTMPPPPNGAPVQLSSLRQMGWPVGAPNLLFPPGGNFLGPPPLIPGANVAPNSQSRTLTQLGTLLHNQAAQLAMEMCGGRPGGPGMGIPPHISISALLQSHGLGPQQQPHFPQTTLSAQNGDTKRATSAQDVNEVIDMDVDSPYSPGDTLDTEEPHMSDSKSNVGAHASSSTNPSESSNRFKDRFDCLLGFVQSRKENVQARQSGHGRGRGHHASRGSRDRSRDDGRRRQDAQKKHIVRFEIPDRSHKGFRGGAKDKKVEDNKKEVTVKMDETQLKILDELPSSAVEMQVKEKFLKKLNRQERVIEEVKLAIKPYYNRREISKEDYKEILRKSVPKICHNKSGEINPVKIKALVEGYVKKFKYHRKGGDSSKGGSSKKS